MDLFFGSDDGTVSSHVEKELMHDFKRETPSHLKPLSNDDKTNIEKMFVYQQLLLVYFNKPEIKNPYDAFVAKYKDEKLPVTCSDGTLQVPIYKLDYLDMFKLSYMSKLPKYASVIDIKEGTVIDKPEDIFQTFKMNVNIKRNLFENILSPLNSFRKNLTDAVAAESIKKVYNELQDINNIIVTISLLGLPKVYKYIFYKLTYK